MKKQDVEMQTQEFRDYVTTLLSLFIFSAGIGLRSIQNNFIPYLCTLIFTGFLMIYISMRYGVKGLNQKRKLLKINGIVPQEVYEEIQKNKGEIYIVEKFEKIDFIRYIILSISFLFLITSKTFGH